MKFTKMQGCGNDYVYINGFEEKIPDHSKAAIMLSNRHFGVGSDGLIFINPSDIADFEMEMYNSDGSRAEMCGNGIRCVGKYVYDHKLTEKKIITVNTLAGIKTLKLKVENDKVSEVTVNMGMPILDVSKIPVKKDYANENLAIGVKIFVDKEDYKMTCVSMGNPHAVIFIDCEEKEVPIEKLGPLFENHDAFPEKVNTEFVKVCDRTHIEMRVWERGAGETFACGTGACAAVVASILNGYTDNAVEVKLQGGNLFVEWDREKNNVYMTGPAVSVFDGEIENLELPRKAF